MDKRALHSVQDWFDACPPKGGLDQWKDGYSAKESAKAWFREQHLSLPREIASLLESCSDLRGFRLGTVTPELRTKLDGFRNGRNADVVAFGVAKGGRTLIAVEAKASESFGPLIGERLETAITTKVPKRINALSQAIFGRPVVSVDTSLAQIRYQLLHAVAGAVIEAKERGAEQVLFAVHYFPNGRRPISEAFSDFSNFVTALWPGSRVEEGCAVRVTLPGSDRIPAEMPLYIGWATARSEKQG
jgi:hypothetical protein